MTQAKLIREKSGKFGLVVNGVIFNDQIYNHYQFAATGRNQDGSRLDVAAELGIKKYQVMSITSPIWKNLLHGQKPLIPKSHQLFMV